MVPQDCSTAGTSFELTHFFLKCCCAHKQPCHSCKSSDILLHTMKPMGMGLPSAPRGCLHPHPHPPALTAQLFAPPTSWKFPSLPFYLPATDIAWRESPCWLKANAASEALGCPVSVYSAVKFTVSLTPSLCREDRVPYPLKHGKTTYPNT